MCIRDSRHRHNSPGAVLHYHEICGIDGHLLTVNRVYHKVPKEKAVLLRVDRGTFELGPTGDPGAESSHFVFFLCAACEAVHQRMLRGEQEEGDAKKGIRPGRVYAVSYTHLRAHETRHDLVCRLLLEKKKK